MPRARLISDGWHSPSRHEARFPRKSASVHTQVTLDLHIQILSTCVSLGDNQGLAHGTLHNDEAATRLRQLITHGESVVETGIDICILVIGAVSTVDLAC
jgi:hypothetical protein